MFISVSETNGQQTSCTSLWQTFLSDMFSSFWLLLVIGFDYAFIPVLSDLIEVKLGQRETKFQISHEMKPVLLFRRELSSNI